MKRLFLLFLILPLFADDDLVFIETYSDIVETKGEYIKEFNDFMPDFKEVQIIKITSNDDEVSIKNVVVNRNNCKLKNPLKNEVKLKFGESLFFKHNCSSVLEISLDINDKNYVYRMD